MTRVPDDDTSGVIKPLGGPGPGGVGNLGLLTDLGPTPASSCFLFPGGLDVASGLWLESVLVFSGSS